MEFEMIKPGETGSFTFDEIAEFLHEHLDEFGDPKEDIRKCIDYAMSTEPNMGGFILLSHEDGVISGAVIYNSTSMKDYIPGNILVYIAVNSDFRGQGLGTKLMKRSFEEADGAVALHVEPDNPARFLYEKVGMESKYKEYRISLDN